MNFLETQFPADISYGATGGPTYSTDVVTIVSGHEQRNSNWKNSRAKYNISTGVNTEEQWQALISFFRACKGKAYGFRFKDWSDYKVSRQRIAIADGVRSEFQLVKTYSSGDSMVTRVIKKAVKDTVKMYSQANLRVNLDYSVDHTTGIITFTEAPSAGTIIMADFEFDVPVRFDTDELQLSIDSFNSGSWSGISLIEIRV